ncbi:universal stress protein [Ornithinimicrobium sp. W1665]|uniref:universal stress protein n=1 Tax=Ornithinimicrobium sp. W1665 TaxID=3416666 RepID=UPI003CF074B8
MSATVRALGPVLVGVDGSASAASAVAWATAEASAEGTRLVLVHDSGAGRAVGRALLERARDGARRSDPQARPELVLEAPADEGPCPAGTIGRAVDAVGPDAGATTVVGRRGSGGFRGMRLGSTARRLVHDGTGTLVLVPTGWEPTTVDPQAPVVAVASGTEQEAERVVTAARLRAERDERPLLVVRAGRYGHPVAEVLTHDAKAELIVLARGPTAAAVAEEATSPVMIV